MSEYQAYRDHYWHGAEAGEPCPSCGAKGDEPHGECDYPQFVREMYGIG